MKNIFEINEKYKRSSKRHFAKDKKIDKQIEELKAKQKRMRYPDFNKYLEELGKQILPKIKGAVGFEVYGPFGLENERSIYFHGPGTEKKRKTICGATFTRFGDGYGLKDYAKDSGRFAKGTIGELNGMNFKVIEISKDMNIDWFIKFMRKK